MKFLAVVEVTPNKVEIQASKYNRIVIPKENNETIHNYMRDFVLNMSDTQRPSADVVQFWQERIVGLQ